MSSLIRRIQRTVRRVRDPETGEWTLRQRRPHYMGRGDKLGTPIAAKPKQRKPAKKARAMSRAKLVEARRKAKAAHKARVAQTYRAPTRAERNEQHRAKMAEKKRRRG